MVCAASLPYVQKVKDPRHCPTQPPDTPASLIHWAPEVSGFTVVDTCRQADSCAHMDEARDIRSIHTHPSSYRRVPRPFPWYEGYYPKSQIQGLMVMLTLTAPLKK